MKKLLIAIVATGLLGAAGSALAGNPHHPHGKSPGLHSRADQARPSPLQRKILQARHDNRRDYDRRNDRGYEWDRDNHYRHDSRRHHSRNDHSRNYRGHKHGHHRYHPQPSRYHGYRGGDRRVFGVGDGARGVLIWSR